MASISGSVTIAGDPDDWIACAFDADTHAFAGVAAVSAGAYEITGLTAGKAYVVACRPKTGPAWAASRVTAETDYTVPTDPVSTPYLFKATSPGITDSVLLHMDGANGGTTFTDETGKSWSVVGDAKTSTAQSKFGGSAGLFDGNDAITTPADTDFQFGTGDFVIETWLYPTSSVAAADFIGHRNVLDPDTFWFVRRDTSGNVRFYNKVSTSVIFDITTSGATVPNNAWSHVACVRNGTAINVYINGTSRGSATTSSAMAYPAYPLRIGAGDDTGGLIGYMDEVRLRADNAGITGNFTPAASAYLGSSTGSTEPTWPTTPGNTVADGDVTWINMGQLVQPLMQGPLIAA